MVYFVFITDLVSMACIQCIDAVG